MSKEEKNIEDIFKDSFEDFEADVSKDVWKNVQTGLKGAGIGVLIKTVINKLGSNAIIAISSSAATILSTVLIMNATGDKKTAQTNSPGKPKTTVENPAPVKVEEIRDFLKNGENSPVLKEKESAKKENTAPEKKKEDTNSIKIKKDPKALEAAIHELSDQSVASVSASTIGGAVPLIVSFSNNGNGKTNKWDFGDGKKEMGANPIHVYEVPGIYTVVLTSTGADGKTVTDNIKIEVTANSTTPNDIADTFSPNGDGERDEFILKLENMLEVEAVIFDDQQTILYSLSAKKDNAEKDENGKNYIMGKWDGNNLKGKPVKEGVYFYIVNCTGVDGKKYEKKGRINLTR
jgi:PKD repeat protein